MANSSWLLLAVLVLNGMQSNSDASNSCLKDLPVVSKQQRSFKHGGKELPLTIAYSRRLSHQVSSLTIKILLEEGLGYNNVELKEISQFSVNSRVACAQDALINTEVWVPFSDPAHKRCHGMVDVGPLGITGRSGWFTSKNVVNSEWTKNQIPLDHWRSLQLPTVGQQFPNAGDVVHVNTTCYGCVKHVFYPPLCDPDRNGNASNCILLIAGVKGNWSDVVEQQITFLALNVSVAWLGSHVHSKVSEEEAKNRPVLFHCWDPDPLSISDKFVRIAFPECRSPWHSSPSVSFANQSTGCESPVYELHKFAAKELEDTDIYHLLQHFFLTKESLAEMFHDYNQTHNQELEKTVCNWLRKSRDVWLPWLPTHAHDKRTVFIGGMFPNLAGSEAVWTSPGDEVGAQMAVDHVNGKKDVLTSYRLKLLSASTQCRRELVIQAYVHYLNREPGERIIGVLGPACSKATMPVSQVSPLRNTIMMGYGADDVSLSNRTKFPLYFRTVPTIGDFKFVYLSLFEALGWTQCAALRENKYPENTVRSRTNFLTKNGIEVLLRELSTVNGLDATSYVRALKDSKRTVILLDAYPTTTRAIMCEAYKQSGFDSQTWLHVVLTWLVRPELVAQDSFNDPQHSAPEKVPCDSEQMKSMVEQGYFSLSPSHYGDEEQEIISGRTVRQWKQEYQRKTKDENKTVSDYATFAYDAVWAYALALDKLTNSHPQGLDTINSRNTTMIFKEYIQETQFLGASGHVHFRSADRQSTILVKQNFATYSKVIGEYVPTTNSSESGKGKLQLYLPRITWATGHTPLDSLLDRSSQKQCGVETLRKSLDLTCAEATALASVIGITLVVLLLAIAIYVLKRRYSSKYKTTKNRLRELGLLNGSRSTHIFALDEWEIPADKILLNRKLGEGAFGAVFGGEALGVVEEERPIPVAVKALRTGSTVEEKVEFLSEADKMKQFSHQNIVQLLAVCTVGEPVYIVMELMIHGDLKCFLLARRRVMNRPGSPEADEVVPRRLTSMALDIARGLEYLAKSKFVHRDLALRNCMIGFGKVVKIGDFGLSRPLMGSDYYRYERKGMFPVRWMSPESLREGMFTRCTDVWSYGVALWELLTFGGFPYQGLSNTEVMERVCEGETVSIPAQCTFETASLLRMCWSWDPLDRPTAARIVQILSESPELIHACVGVPATTVDDDSTGKFDATRVRKLTGVLSS